MSEPIISIDTIKRQAQRAADIGTPASGNPYTIGTKFSELWLASHEERVAELERATQQQTTSHQYHCAPRARKAI